MGIVNCILDILYVSNSNIIKQERPCRNMVLPFEIRMP